MPTYDREDDTSRKEYRKPYILSEGGYQDMMRTTWDKSVWNEILEIDPVWAEFLFTRADLPDAATAAEIRYLRYIKQSEFKKQFGNNFDYNEMEYVWEGFLPTWDDNFSFDFPWRSIEGGGVYDDEPPISIVCDADVGSDAGTDDCYCPGLDSDVTFTGNWPITGIDFIHDEGESVSGVSGAGTNSATFTISSPDGRSGQMRINVCMSTPNGECCSTVNIYPCPEDECCPDECDLAYDSDNSVETIVAPGGGSVLVTGGTGPFTWSISSEDGLWSLASTTTAGRSNTVSAAAGACGSATITVTDACGCVTTGSVRNPSNGSWQRVCTDIAADPNAGCCYFSGVPDSASGGPNWTLLKTVGKYRQTAKVNNNGIGIQVTIVSTESQAAADAECEAERSAGKAGACQTRCNNFCVTSPQLAYGPCNECLQPLPLTMWGSPNLCGTGAIPTEYGGVLTGITEYCCDVNPGFLARYAYSCWCTNALWVDEWKC
jgi:hypothetical protein